VAILRHVIIFLLILSGTVLHAETIPKSTVFYTGWTPTQRFASGDAACSAACGPHKASANGANSGCNSSCGVGTDNHCYFSTDRTPTCERLVEVVTETGCLTGYTANGTNCERPDCPAGQSRNPDGTCQNACEARAQGSPTYSWFKSSVGGQTVEGSYCDGTCMVGVNPAPTGTAYNNGKEKIQRYEIVTTSAPCTSSNIPTKTDAANEPPEPPKKPLCAPTEGVLTTSAGTIACVPPGVPTQSTPEIKKAKSVEQFPDGSTKTTETTYTKDPVSQVQDTKQTITTTGATGGGAGQAGPVGVTTVGGTSGTSSGENPTPETTPSDFCKSNPGLQICKNDMNKEETQIQVRDYIKSLTDPGSTPYTAIENATHSETSHTELQTELDKFTAAADGSVSPNASSKNAWESAMNSGWFEPITRQGCAPYTATIGGRTWTLDICPTAEKISVISEYVIWFLIVVGTFVMLTGGAFTRSS